VEAELCRPPGTARGLPARFGQRGGRRPRLRS
jgi:hypothetical protein